MEKFDERRLDPFLQFCGTECTDSSNSGDKTQSNSYQTKYSMTGLKMASTIYVFIVYNCCKSDDVGYGSYYLNYPVTFTNCVLNARMQKRENIVVGQYQDRRPHQ
jgi:hypothetical protein